VQFVLRYAKGGGSNTESLINHLKSKHRIHAILGSEDHKTIPAQGEIRSQIVKTKTSIFEATNKRSNYLKNCTLPYLQSSQNQLKSMEP